MKRLKERQYVNGEQYELTGGLYQTKLKYSYPASPGVEKSPFPATAISSSYKITPVMPKPRCGTLTNATAAMVIHRLMSSAMRSNDDNDWPVHCLMLSDLQGLPLRRLPSTVPFCSMIFGSHTYSLVLCSLYDIMSSILPQHFFSKAWVRLSGSAASIQLSHLWSGNSCSQIVFPR